MIKFLNKLILIPLILSGVYCIAADQPNQNEDEAAIRKISSGLTEAFNKHDADKVASFWSEDAKFYHPLTGVTSTGRKEIKEYYEKQFSQDHVDKVEVFVDNIEVTSPNEAVEKGLFRMSFKDQPPLQSAFEAYLTKKDGKWTFDELTDVKLVEAPTNYEHLKDLTWLIGNWVDNDNIVEISYEANWDKYKNFITQHFNTKIYDHPQVEGRQLIAWDPIKEKIRSWVFDSDGGFGEGTWAKVGNDWRVKMVYTLPDGKVASATQLYSNIKDDSYTFASIDRVLDGDILPNIKPVTIERKKEGGTNETK